jgi:glycosyltransferase involved in cell wall biosynthesis
MFLSVQISTYNRRDLLKTALQRLAKQTYPSDQFEVVISDDGSTDGTTEMIEEAKKTMPFTIRHFWHEHYGVGRTHNLGIKKSKGEIVLMLANDILTDSELIEQHVKSHEEHPKLTDVVVGKLIQSSGLPDTPFQRNWDALINNLFAGKLKNIPYMDFKVSNISFKKDFIVSSGMFRDWPSGSHEDFELRYRLKQKGMKIITNLNAVGYHHHVETIDSVSKRSYMHGLNWFHFENSVPDLWIRLKSGNVKMEDGTGLYINTHVKNVLRYLILNRISISYFVIPLLKKAEYNPCLNFLIPFLTGKIASYHFCKGIRDSRKVEKKN